MFEGKGKNEKGKRGEGKIHVFLGGIEALEIIGGSGVRRRRMDFLLRENENKKKLTTNNK